MLEFEVKNSEISSHLPSKKIQSQKKITITRKKNNEKSSKGNQKCQNIFNPLKSNWLEKYKPKSITDLKVHHTKLKALRDWLEKAQGIFFFLIFNYIISLPKYLIIIFKIMIPKGIFLPY